MIERDRNVWKPTPPQELFISLPWTIKEAFFGGGVGGGKSDLLLILPIARGLHTNPRFKQLFTRRTHAELKKEIVPRSREIYPRFGATFNATDMVWTFPRVDQFGSGAVNRGAMIFFGHCEHEKDVAQYDGMEINLFTPDELTSFTEHMYRYIAFTRVRTSDPNLPAVIRAAGMPGGEGHTFVKNRFVKPHKEGGVIINGKAGIKRFYVHSTLLDNPYLDDDYKNSILSLPEAEKKAKLGDWDAFSGQVFDEFRDKRYAEEPDNALHVIEPFQIPSWWPRIVVGDWGYSAMCWIGFAAIAPNGRVYVYRELTYLKTKIAIWATELREYVEEENPKLIRFCQSAGQDRGQDNTIRSEIEKYLGQSISLTVNKAGSRVQGKMLLHEYLRWKPLRVAPHNPPPYNEELAWRIRRVKGDIAYNEYMQQFIPPVQETNIPRLLFFAGKTEKVVDAIKACFYDKNNVEDVAEFAGDDPYDGIRYLVDASDFYVKVAKAEMEKFQAEEKIIQQLNGTQDFTAYYRNMRTLESENNLPQSVGRYHGRRH